MCFALHSSSWVAGDAQVQLALTRRLALWISCPNLLPLLLSPHPSYSFLYDEKMPEEREELRAALKKAKGQAARTELQVGGRRCAC